MESLNMLHYPGIPLLRVWPMIVLVFIMGCGPSTAATPGSPTAPAAGPTDATAPVESQGRSDAVSVVVGEGSEATFTVNEKLSRLPLPNDAVVRTEALSGMVHLDGQPSVIEIDLHQLQSDQSRRDRLIPRRMFPQDPIATFTVPNLASPPENFASGEVVSRPVSGQLNILGVDRPITFEVEARLDADALFILGRTSFTWDQLGIPPPNISGRIQVKDEVKVEVLVAARPQ